LAKTIWTWILLATYFTAATSNPLHNVITISQKQRNLTYYFWLRATTFEEVWFFTLQSSTDIMGWDEGTTWQYIGFNSLVGGHTRSANGQEHNPFVNKYRSHNNTLPIVCSYAPILESIIIIIIIIANYSRDVFCPKFATLTVSKIRVKICSQWCSQINPNWWCLCKP
jgi:hypothetical protein